MPYKQLERLETKLDKIGDDIGNINVTLAKQHVTLEEHIRRTELLEQKILPLERHVSATHGVLKFLGVVGVLAAIVEGLFTALEYFKK